MGPYGSVGADIKTGRIPMAQDHFKTPPDPKQGHEMTKNPQTSKKSSRVGQEEQKPRTNDQDPRTKGPRTQRDFNVKSDNWEYFFKVLPNNILSIRFCTIVRGEQLSEK